MTFITSVLLYVFGLNASTGKADVVKKVYSAPNFNKNVYTKENGDIIIYYPNYDAKNNAAFYKSPNFIVPAPHYENKSTPAPTLSNTTTSKTQTNSSTTPVPSTKTPSPSSTTPTPSR